MNPEHDADLFGEEVDYERFWRDQYHQLCEQYEELLAVSEGSVEKFSCDNDGLQRQLHQARAVIAAFREEPRHKNQNSNHSRPIIPGTLSKAEKAEMAQQPPQRRSPERLYHPASRLPQVPPTKSPALPSA